MVENYKQFLHAQPSRLEAVAHTLMHRRPHLAHRTFAVVTDDCDSLAFGSTPAPTFRPTPKSAGVAFVFTGQGAQWARMGSHLLKSSREFLQDIREMDAVLKSLPKEHRPSWDIRGKFTTSFIVAGLNLTRIKLSLCALMPRLASGKPSTPSPSAQLSRSPWSDTLPDTA